MQGWSQELSREVPLQIKACPWLQPLGKAGTVQGEKAAQVDGCSGGHSGLGAGCIAACIAGLNRFVLQGDRKSVV